MNLFYRTILSVFMLLFAVFGLSNSVMAQTQITNPQIAKNADTSSKTETPEKENKNEPKIETNENSILKRVGVENQNTMVLTLNDAIRRALENNNDIEIAKTDVRFQETQLRSLNGIYDPVLSFSPTFTRNSTTGSTGTNDFRVNAGVTKFIKQGGGDVQVFFNNVRTENSFSQAQLSSGNTSSGGALYSSSYGINYTQPLVRNFSTDNTRRQIKIQKKRLQQSDADFRRFAIETISRVQNAYWDLVFALRDQQNKVANLNLSKENLRQIEAKIAAGAAAPLQKAEVETELANRESEVLVATQQVSIAENTLKTLLLREPDSPDWYKTIVPTDNPVFSDEPISLDNAMKDALDNRYELRRLRLQKEINTIDISYFKNQTRPQIDLNTTFSLEGFASGINNNADRTVPTFTGNDEILRQNINVLLGNAGLPQIPNPPITIPASPSFLVGGFNRSLANTFRGDAPNYSIGITFSFPLRNKTAKANLAGARIQEEQISAQTRSQEQIIIAEVRNAVQAVDTARQRILTARRARTNAEIQLEGERRLFDSGRSTTFLLFQRENALTNARNAEIRAETDYNKALSDLQRVTSTTFRANGIDVTSPTDVQD